MTANQNNFDPFDARDTFETAGGSVGIYRLSKLEEAGLAKVSRLPFSIRVLLESVLRNCDGYEVSEEDVKSLAGWSAGSLAQVEIPFKPARVVLVVGEPGRALDQRRAAGRRRPGCAGRVGPLGPGLDRRACGTHAREGPR